MLNLPFLGSGPEGDEVLYNTGDFRSFIRPPQALSCLKSALSGLKYALSGLKSALSGLKSALSGLKFALTGLKSACQALNLSSPA